MRSAKFSGIKCKACGGNHIVRNCTNRAKQQEFAARNPQEWNRLKNWQPKKKNYQQQKGSNKSYANVVEEEFMAVSFVGEIVEAKATTGKEFSSDEAGDGPNTSGNGKAEGGPSPSAKSVGNADTNKSGRVPADPPVKEKQSHNNESDPNIIIMI